MGRGKTCPGNASGMEKKRISDEFEVRERPPRNTERADRIARLKREIRDGSYEPDIRDIARLLTSAMDPTL